MARTFLAVSGVGALAGEMRFFVQGEGSSQPSVVPYGDPAGLVEGLKKAILERLCEGEAPSEHYSLSLAGCGAAISDKDVIQEVLRDGDCLLLKSEWLKMLPWQLLAVLSYCTH